MSVYTPEAIEPRQRPSVILEARTFNETIRTGILKHDGQALCLVRETKGTRDFLTLHTSEADKANCGKGTSR